MAPSMRLKATRRPPASHTATLILMLSSRALATAPCTIRFASSRVRATGSLLWCEGTLRGRHGQVRQLFEVLGKGLGDARGILDDDGLAPARGQREGHSHAVVVVGGDGGGPDPRGRMHGERVGADLRARFELSGVRGDLRAFPTRRPEA